MEVFLINYSSWINFSKGRRKKVNVEIAYDPWSRYLSWLMADCSGIYEFATNITPSRHLLTDLSERIKFVFDMNYKGTISLLDPVSFSSITYSKITEDEQINLAQTEWARIKKSPELLIVREQYHKYLTGPIYWQLLTNLKKRIWQENYDDDLSQMIASKIVKNCYRGKTTDLLTFTLRLQIWISDRLKLLHQNSYNDFPFEQDQFCLNCWYFSKNNDELDDLTNGLKVKKLFDYHVEYNPVYLKIDKDTCWSSFLDLFDVKTTVEQHYFLKSHELFSLMK